MKWSTITSISLLVGSALSAPVTSTTAELNIPDELRNQGDGFYTASLNEDGEIDVEFTPMAELVARDYSPVPDHPIVLSPPPNKNGITCDSGHASNVADLDSANIQLAKNSPNEWIRGWGWVHVNQETAYWCNYARNWVNFDLVVVMQVDISTKCGGSAAYGFNHYFHTPWATDFVVGRTFTGDNFCTRSFRGKRDPAPVPAPKPFTVAKNSMQQGNGFSLATINEAGEQVAETMESIEPTKKPTQHSRRENMDGTEKLVSSRQSTPSGVNIASDLMFQGDGFYTATVDESGAIDVEFTPMAELPPTAELLSEARTAGLLDHVSDSVDSLHKRNTECEGRDSGSQSDLDGANVQLAHNADGKTYSPRAWGWVHNNGETSYFCPYARKKVSYREVIKMHTVTSRKCGVAGYGWDHQYVVQGTNFAVGRTFHGNHFCTDTFTGGRTARDIETPSAAPESIGPAPVESSPAKTASISADASSWDMTSGQMDQGDGLYVANLDDETGELSIKFTPTAKLGNIAPRTPTWSLNDIPSDQMDQGDGLYIASLNDETGQMSVEFTPIARLSSPVPRAPMSDNPAADSMNELSRRDGDKTTCRGGNSKNVADLDYANRELAVAGSRTNLKKSPAGWLHNNGETSYWCATQGPSDWREPYDYFINQQTIVSNTCGGSSAYGWNSFRGYTVAPPSATDAKPDWTEISVGRTYKGGSICWKDYIPPATAVTAEDKNILSKRDSVKQTCRGGLSKNVPALDYINNEMANYGDQLNLKKSPITWLHKDDETSYWCLSEGMDGWTTNRDYFIDQHLKISSHCDGGSAAYGWSHSRGYVKFKDLSVWTELSVGRTFKGGSICRKDFAPPSAAASIESSPHSAAFDSRSPIQEQSITTDAVEPTRKRSDMHDQGDGLYYVTTNEAGESNIDFTPIAEVASRLSTKAAGMKSNATTTTDILPESASIKQWCRGWSKNTPDLDRANEFLANIWDGQYLRIETYAYLSVGQEVSYICAYGGYRVVAEQVIAAHIRISQACKDGSQRYGWESRKGLGIGRTWKGDKFC